DSCARVGALGYHLASCDWRCRLFAGPRAYRRSLRGVSSLAGSVCSGDGWERGARVEPGETAFCGVQPCSRDPAVARSQRIAAASARLVPTRRIRAAPLTVDCSHGILGIEQRPLALKVLYEVAIELAGDLGHHPRGFLGEFRVCRDAGVSRDRVVALL